MTAPTDRCPYCGITWAAWPGTAHVCRQPVSAATTGRITFSPRPADAIMTERIAKLEAVREAALVVIDNGHGPGCSHGLRPTLPCKCGWDELRAALDAVDAP